MVAAGLVIIYVVFMLRLAFLDFDHYFYRLSHNQARIASIVRWIIVLLMVSALVGFFTYNISQDESYHKCRGSSVRPITPILVAPIKR
jgi:hypothetical protein